MGRPLLPHLDTEAVEKVDQVRVRPVVEDDEPGVHGRRPVQHAALARRSGRVASSVAEPPSKAPLLPLVLSVLSAPPRLGETLPPVPPTFLFLHVRSFLLLPPPSSSFLLFSCCAPSSPSSSSPSSPSSSSPSSSPSLLVLSLLVLLLTLPSARKASSSSLPLSSFVSSLPPSLSLPQPLPLSLLLLVLAYVVAPCAVGTSMVCVCPPMYASFSYMTTSCSWLSSHAAPTPETPVPTTATRILPPDAPPRLGVHLT